MTVLHVLQSRLFVQYICTFLDLQIENNNFLFNVGFSNVSAIDCLPIMNDYLWQITLQSKYSIGISRRQPVGI